MMNNILLVTILAFLYFITGKLSLELLNGDNIINIGVFAAEGIALAFALYFGKRVLLGIFLGQLALALINDVPYIASLLISLINTTEAYLAIVLFQRFGFDTRLLHFRDILGLVGLIIFVLQPFSALSSNSVLLLLHQIPYDSFLHYSFSWWFGNVMGQLLFTPFLLLLFHNFKKIDFVEFFLYGAVFGIYFYILQIELLIENALLLLSLSLPVILVVIARKGIVYGILFNVVVAIIASYSVYIDVGSFAVNSYVDNVINYNLFVLAHISIAFTVGILIEERKTYAKTLEESIATEVKKNQEQQLLMLQQSRLAQMGEMISMIAHQWRQPLNNLSLINQLLISKYTKGKLNDEAMEYFKANSKKQIDLMSTTIDDFRNFFKKENKAQEFFLNDVISEVLNMTAAIYTSKGIKIEFDSQDNYQLYGYANGLAQVILNIINNAKDALIESVQENKKIQISIMKKADDIVLHIKDNAGGIAPDIIDKIFDPYFSTKKDKNGTGLGLYMSKMIIQEQLQAKIEAYNDTEGANFVIYLPQGEK